MRIILFVLMLTLPCYGVDANDIRITQRDPTATFNATRDIAFPGLSGGVGTPVNGVLVMNAATTQPAIALLAGGIVFDGTSLKLSGVNQSDISGLAYTLGTKVDAASLSTVATTGDYNDLINKPATGTPVQSKPTPALATAYQPSTTRGALLNASVVITTSITLTGGAEAYAIAEIASNSGMTTSLQEVGRITNGQSGSLVIGVAITQKSAGVLSFYVPAGYYFRITQVNVTTTGGTPTVTVGAVQQTLL